MLSSESDGRIFDDLDSFQGSQHSNDGVAQDTFREFREGNVFSIDHDGELGGRRS